MPIRFARDLAYGQKPREVPPPGGGLTAGAMVSPAANELPALAQVSGDNLHLQGTPMRPGFSAQVEPLRRPVMDDPEAAGAVGDPTKVGPMATRAESLTQAMERPEQGLMRLEHTDTNRSDQRLKTDMQNAGSFVSAVAMPQRAQMLTEQERVMNLQEAALRFSSEYRAEMIPQLIDQNRIDPRQEEAMNRLSERMLRPGSQFAIGG